MKERLPQPYGRLRMNATLHHPPVTEGNIASFSSIVQGTRMREKVFIRGNPEQVSQAMAGMERRRLTAVEVQGGGR